MFLKKASPEQIERILTKVAEHKGFKTYVTINNAHLFGGNYSMFEQPYTLNNNNTDTFYNIEKDGLHLLGAYIYENGNWAEIIEKPKITFGGKEVTFCIRNNEIYVKRNQKLSKLNDFKTLLESFNFILNDMTFKIGCTQGTMKELKNIIEQGNKFELKYENKS